MRCKRLLSLTLAAAMLFGSAAALPEGVFDDGAGIIASAAEVESGKCGENVFWSLDDKGVLTISGTGKMYDYDSWYSYSPFYQRDDIMSVIIKSGVTNIGECAFYNCTSLKSVTIPSSVTSIGKSAFSGCEKLISVTIPSSVTSIGGEAFFGCEKLTSVTIPSSVTSIREWAFFCCSSLEKVTFGSGKTKFENGRSFENCPKLTELVIENDFDDFFSDNIFSDSTRYIREDFENITKLGVGKG